MFFACFRRRVLLYCASTLACARLDGPAQPIKTPKVPNMARVTVEDCVTIIPNRFELVMMAAQRCRLVTGGSQITIPKDNDKLPVIALREIAGETINLADVKEELIKSYQRVIETPEDEADLEEFMTGEEGYMPPIHEENPEFAVLAESALEDELDLPDDQPDVDFDAEFASKEA